MCKSTVDEDDDDIESRSPLKRGHFLVAKKGLELREAELQSTAGINFLKLRNYKVAVLLIGQ